MKAWHFLQNDGSVRYMKGYKPKVGETLTVKGRLQLCSKGLHASKNISQALRYAPGHILCEVELSGEIIKGSDKICARKRTIIRKKNVKIPFLELFCSLLKRKVRGNKCEKQCIDVLDTLVEYVKGRI